MSGILQELLNKTNNSNSLEQMRIICDQIKNEEKQTQQYLEFHPLGPRILLSLDVPGNTNKEIGFLTVEVEDEDSYLIRYYTLKKQLLDLPEEESEGPRVKKYWVINDPRPEKVLLQFAKKLKMIKGE